MLVQSIQSNKNFKANPIFLSPALSQGMKNLKNKMEAETVIVRSKDFNQVIRVRGLQIQDKAVFKNGKYLAKKDKNNKMVPYGENTSMLEFNGVRIIARDDGSVIEHKKPLFKSWTNILEQAENFIQFALNNYNNESCIKRIVQKKETLTPFGKKQAEQVLNIFDKLNPWS